MYNTNSGDLWKTNTRRSLTENGWILRKRTSCLDYSKHLCCGKRLAISIEKRPSKSVSDTDAVALIRHFGINRGDYNSGNVTLDANAERNPQKQVYYIDKKFHRKYSNKKEGEETNALPPPKHRSWINTPTSKAYFKTDYDDCARSFCDSVSSVACSNLSNSVEMERQRKHILSNKVSKISAVESWLQGLTKPLL